MHLYHELPQVLMKPCHHAMEVISVYSEILSLTHAFNCNISLVTHTHTHTHTSHAPYP
jgi:hypothetical protein